MQVECAVRALFVVMPDIDAQDAIELASAEDEQPVQALPPQAADPAPMCAFAFGAWSGVRMTLIPSLWKAASKARPNFASRSWIRNRGCRPRSSRSMSRLRACWTIQAPSGLLVEAMYSIRRLPMRMNAST